jgi:1,4-alpha-glucan branching enzyme
MAWLMFLRTLVVSGVLAPAWWTGDPLAMRRLADGWHELDADCGAGTAYRYQLGDGRQAPAVCGCGTSIRSTR